MIDFALLLIVGIVTWCVAAEGAWSAAFIFLTVILSGLVAMNWFEPLSNQLEAMTGPDWSARLDFICLVGLFSACVFGLRLLSERIVPSFIAVHSRFYDAARWGFALATGYVTMAILLTALHTAPLPREFMGFTPERRNFLNFSAPDRQWLGFVQYVSETSLRSSEGGRVFDNAPCEVLNHENQVWPTFIIRYASRRDAIGGGAALAESASPAGAAAGGGGSGGGSPGRPGGI